MATSLIRPLQVSGGTFYVFPSAALNISKTFSDDNFRFVFSKFACLDLPSVKIPTNNLNTINWQAIGNSSTQPWSSVVLSDILSGSPQPNVHIANSFQNYALNLENLILSTQNSDGLDYDDSIKNTPSEHIFWKWLAETGAIRYMLPGTDVTTSSSLFVEESTNTTNNTLPYYNKVVKYLGDIDIVNNVKQSGQAYTEVYLHIPTSHGTTPDILFKVNSHNNYKPTLSWTGSTDLIEGRTSHPDNRMSINAYYDDNLTNKYNTATVFGDVTNEIVTISTDVAGVNTYQINKTNMDGVQLSWDLNNYKKITDSPSIRSIADFNASALAEDFSFNTVLVYYDIFDASNPTDVTRNLYGVLFIDDFDVTLSSGSKLKTYDKFKPNSVTKTNGNAYGLKLNIKFDTSADNVGIEKVINEYNTYSMDLYSDAMITLASTIDIFKNLTDKVLILENKVQELSTYATSSTSISDLQKQMNELTTSVNNAMIGLESPTSLIELINNCNQKINDLIKGKLTSQLTYDLNPFTSGSGISIDKTIPNKIKINNKVQTYNSFSTCYTSSGNLSYNTGNGVTNTNDITYLDNNNILFLGEYSNYFKNYTDSGICNGDLIINIDDSLNKWSKGQVFRISFNNSIEFGSPLNNIKIYTDTKNRFKSGEYKHLIASISSTDLSAKPILEIICVNQDKYKFEIEIIK